MFVGNTKEKQTKKKETTRRNQVTYAGVQGRKDKDAIYGGGEGFNRNGTQRTSFNFLFVFLPAPD